MAAGSQLKSALTSDSEGYTRLHITPFDADLLKVIVPAATLPQARNISYHNIETFPAKRYGFVEVPTADAEKLRKKLNGATLRGSKVRIEQARPEPVLPPIDAMGEDSGKTKKVKKEKRSDDKKEKKEKSKKRNLEAVVEGVEIEPRKIKRGWTVTESDKIQEKRRDKSKKSADEDKEDKKEEKKKLKKREIKSKYTDAPECLFKQKIPEAPREKAPEEPKDDDEDQPKRKKRRSGNLVVVHEFGKTHKYPTFLKDTTEKRAPEPLTFEDGKGWLDADGHVVESTKSKRPDFSKVKAPKKQRPKPAPIEDDTTSSSGSSSESESDSEGEPVDDEDGTSNNGSSPDNDEETQDKEVKTPELPQEASKKLKLDTQAPTSPSTATKNDSSRPKSSGSATSLTIKIPSIAPGATDVHPLEALYKRPAGTEAPVGEVFSFFDGGGNNNDDIEEEDTVNVPPSGSQVPMTPFSKQDYDFRNMRSAAPTPDTAHPSQSYNLWPRQRSVEDSVEEDDEEDTSMTGITDPTEDDKAGPKSEFQDWFWEHRGDLNRSWKKRRKTASKEKRNRENRARAAKTI